MSQSDPTWERLIPMTPALGEGAVGVIIQCLMCPKLALNLLWSQQPVNSLWTWTPDSPAFLGAEPISMPTTPNLILILRESDHIQKNQNSV